MKKSVVLLASLFLMSCSSDSDTPAVRCNCGAITKIVVGGTINGNTMMTYSIKSDCTGEILTIQTFNTDYIVGQTICKID
jgi:hypothetical protein